MIIIMIIILIIIMKIIYITNFRNNGRFLLSQD